MATAPAASGKSIPLDASFVGTCASTSHVENIFYEWKISNFSFHLLGAGTNYKLVSAPFGSITNKDLTWQMELFPNGEGDGNKGHLTVNLYLALSTRPEVKAKCKIYIKDNEGKLVNETSQNEMTTFGVKKGWTVPKLSAVQALNQNQSILLPNDTLTIICEIFVLSEVKTVSHTKAVEVEKAQDNSIKTCMEAFNNLLKSGEFSDVTIICNEKNFKAHKSILASRSPVFQAMFSNNMKENIVNEVEIKDLETATVKQLLTYIYSGQLLKPEGIYQELLIAAEKYCIESLKSELEELMIQNLTIDNAMETLVLAVKYNAKRLETQTVSFIKVNNIVSLMETEGWSDFLKSCSHLDLDFGNNGIND